MSINSIMNRLASFFNLAKTNFGLYISICFGIFLFVLFFQPFPIDHFDFNNRLVFLGGLSMIVFLLLIFIKVLLHFLFQDENDSDKQAIFPHFLSNFSLLLLSSVAFAFYLRYVGAVHISFFVMVKICIICLVAPVTIWLYEMIVKLRAYNIELIREKKLVQKQVEKYEEDYLNKTVDFISENGKEVLPLLISDVVFIKSADNYGEIVYREIDGFRKRLIRNTMKGIEQQIKMYSNFIRCHRACIVNTHYIENLHKNYSSYYLTLKKYDEKIPVSRQYLLKLREVV
jgi:DNA-binding LytR/AlgR family response regulator